MIQNTISLEGNERILHVFRAGDAFGGLLRGIMQNFLPWIQALYKIRVAVMEETAFKQLMHVAPNACMQLFRYMIEHHVKDIRRLESLST